MLDAAVLGTLIQTHKRTFQDLVQVETDLNERFLGMEAQIRGLILAVACGEPFLLVGPPGTAKSRLIRAFCGTVGLIDENAPGTRDPAYFEYLLTPFTEPSELFGYYDIAALHDRKGLQRLDKGMMQHATVVFLDEVFNASSAILNAILAFMNERVFHDRGEVRPVQMKCLFAATNDVPRTNELRAVFDRFVLRSRVESVPEKPDSLMHLIGRGWSETYSTHHKREDLATLLTRLSNLRRDIGTRVDGGTLRPGENKPLYGNLAHIVTLARQYGLSAVSNRRLVKFSYLMAVHRMYRAVLENRTEPKHLTIGRPELALFWTYFLDSEDPLVVERMAKLPMPME